MIKAFTVALAALLSSACAPKTSTRPAAPAIAIAVRAGGVTRMDFQYLHVVGARFLKVRGTFPGESWKDSEFAEFAREVARGVRIVRCGSYT